MTRALPLFELGYARTELRRKLVAAVLRGEKTATAGLRSDFALTPASVSRVSANVSSCSTSTTSRSRSWRPPDVRAVRAADVDLAFAVDEGEGFETVADWRSAHERFWAQHEIDDDTLIVAERFRLVERL